MISSCRPEEVRNVRGAAKNVSCEPIGSIIKITTEGVDEGHKIFG